jgi:hypothetical protein
MSLLLPSNRTPPASPQPPPSREHISSGYASLTAANVPSDTVIPSLRTWMEAISCLETGASFLKPLFPKKSRKTSRERSLQQQARRSFCSSRQRPHRSQSAGAREASFWPAYQQLWLFALHHSPDWSHGVVRRGGGSALEEVARKAQLLGFDSRAIRKHVVNRLSENSPSTITTVPTPSVTTNQIEPRTVKRRYHLSPAVVWGSRPYLTVDHVFFGSIQCR